MLLLILLLIPAGVGVLWSQNPSAVIESQVLVPGSTPGQQWMLCAPLRRPHKLPTVLLITSSLPGPARDADPAELMATLARSLAEAGVASLRNTNETPKASVQPPSMQVQNAVAALNHMAAIPSVDAGPEFVIGYDLGATIASDVAMQYASTRGIILLNPAILHIEQILATRKRQEMAQEGRSDTEILEALASQNDILSDIRAGKMPLSRMFNGGPARYWADWMNQNPIAELQKLRMPILVLQDRRDEREAGDSYEKLQNALGGDHAEFHWFPELADASTRPGQLSDRVDPRALAALTSWIKRHDR